MICNRYQQLTIVEKRDFLARLQHAAMSNDLLFQCAVELIELGETLGVFEDVKIGFDIEEEKAPARTEAY